MRAAWYEDFGLAKDVLVSGEMDAPTPGDGEVLVRVACSGINPVDVKRRAGGRGDMTDDRVVPHFDGAGTIEETGERVWLYEAQWQSALGTAAEYVCVPKSRAVPLPDNTSFAEGAALGIPALTAHRCVYGDGDVRGQTILVTGGAGAVGNYAVQFARLGGATVIATISSDEKAQLAKKAGAHHVINYRSENVADEINAITDGNGVDRIVEVDFGSNLETSIAVLKVRGVIATYASDIIKEPTVPFYQLVYKNIVVRHELVFIMSEEAKQQAVSDISGWMTAGEILHHLGPKFSLDEIVQAHEAVEGGAYGKVYIEI
jgi:NADPH:quinone reductase